MIPAGPGGPGGPGSPKDPPSPGTPGVPTRPFKRFQNANCRFTSSQMKTIMTENSLQNSSLKSFCKLSNKLNKSYKLIIISPELPEFLFHPAILSHQWDPENKIQIYLICVKLQVDNHSVKYFHTKITENFNIVSHYKKLAVLSCTLLRITYFSSWATWVPSFTITAS